ncbi:hypothetical protein AQUCO_01100381v1 [Aquilegia coerulea]|uniref:MADS-box domain-containing protein n=1 Tax=Aquilegia coerulea TaxID=218851 RepID=A0A2G5E6U9_AQUCA|nr:hypothetical protein AQUCO_01100381v1 [Aquilegia coerulea]
MSRGKLKLGYIVDDDSRKTTFKGRVQGLNKKLSELTTLCGLKACSVILSPYHETPQFWPDEVEARQVLTRFKSTLQQGRNNKVMNHDEFLEKKIAKVKLQVQKQEKENCHLEMTKSMNEALQHGPDETLNFTSSKEAWEFAAFLNNQMKELKEEIEARRNP